MTATNVDKMGTEFDYEAAKAALAQMEGEAEERSEESSDKVRWYKLPKAACEVKVRFLPRLHGQKLAGKRVWTHFSLPGKELKHIKCFKTYDMHCPLCDILETYKAKFGSDLLDEWKSTLSCYFNALILNDSTKPDMNPRLPVAMQFSDDFQFRWLLSNCLNPEVGDITDIHNGSNVTFKREKSEGKFERIISRLQTPIADSAEGIKMILEQAYNWNEVYRNPDDKYVKMMDKAVAAVRRAIEEKIAPLAANSSSANPQTQTQGQERPAATQSQPQTPPPAQAQTKREETNDTPVKS